MKKSTEITFEKKRMYGVEDWQKVAAIQGLEIPPRPSEISNFFQVIWPASENYVSPLNPIFLLDLKNIEESKRAQRWLVRDGLVPLIWFYMKNPKPGQFKGTLRIHAHFEEFVPDAWRPQTELFAIVSDQSEKPHSKDLRIDEILFTGVVIPSVCSITRLESDLAKIADSIGGKENFSTIKIRACLIVRHEARDRIEGLSFYNRYIQTLCKWVGTNIEFIEYEALQWLAPSSNIWFHEFNEKWIYIDSYFNFLPQIKGYRPLLLENLRSFERILPVYPRVAYGVTKKFERPPIKYLEGQAVNGSKELIQMFFNALNSSANKHYPWSQWFENWTLKVPSVKLVDEASGKLARRQSHAQL